MSMTQEDKELLLKDLSARLFYGVKFESENAERVYFIDTSDDEIYINGTNIEDVKPYLFPMSSMTEEQREEFLNIQSDERQILTDALIKYRQGNFEDKIPTIASYKHIDWLNANHFDYRGLIEKDLAIDATNLNIYVNLKTINYEDIFRFDKDFERLS